MNKNSPTIIRETAYLLPCSDLVLRPNPGHIRVPTGLRGNICRFSDHQAPWHAGTLAVVFSNVWKRDMVSISSETSARSEDDTMLQEHIADLLAGKEFVG
jgi:hypothetical protein